MKIAIIGRGKTGSHLARIIPSEQIHDIYSSQNQVSVEALEGADIAIVFVNHQVFTEIEDTLILAKIPIVCGTTGIEWNQNLQNKITASQQPWVVASNFSLAMTLVKNCLSVLGNMEKLVPESTFHIHEVHHTAKLDAPSGTALSWQSWLNTPLSKITYDRVEDTHGIHALTINSPHEKIELNHHAHNRQLFAEGALWTAKQMLSTQYSPGIHHFAEIVQQTLIGETHHATLNS